MATNDLKNTSIDLQRPTVLFAAGAHAGYWLGTTEETACGCNSYRVCDGDRAVRIDPGNRAFFPQVKARVAEVIAPPVIVQAYVVAPAGPDAVFPVVAVQTRGVGGEIAGVAGFALIVAAALPVAEQPDAFVTTSVRFTLPEAPAV